LPGFHFRSAGFPFCGHHFSPGFYIGLHFFLVGLPIGLRLFLASSDFLEQHFHLLHLHFVAVA
jgi:hypothetical protein